MLLEWDDKKNVINKIKHGVDFKDLDDLVWEGAVILPDKRRPYGEARFLAYGMLHERLHVIVFTYRGEAIRIIGARKANDREKDMYDETTEET